MQSCCALKLGGAEPPNEPQFSFVETTYILYQDQRFSENRCIHERLQSDLCPGTTHTIVIIGIVLSSFFWIHSFLPSSVVVYHAKEEDGRQGNSRGGGETR
jgi:hypothetical protein